MKITEALFAEHLVFHHMFDHLEVVAPKLKTLAEVKALAALMEALLKAHSDTEDQLFIGPLEHCFEQIGQRESFHEEHVEIDQSLQQVQAARHLRRAQELLLAAVAYSRRHFDREERVVFPLAEEVLKSKTLTELGQTWQNQRTRRVVYPFRASEVSATMPASAALTPSASAATRAASGKSEGASKV